MKHVHVAGPNEYALVDAPDPELVAPTDALVDVTATTVCGSDAHVIAGHLGIPLDCPLGHEFVGVIRAVGDAVVSLVPGDRVVAPAAPWCGHCASCRAGQIQRRERGGIFGGGVAFGGLGGAMAHRVRVPWADSCLSKVPAGVSDAQALTVGDTLSTGGRRSNRRSRPPARPCSSSAPVPSACPRSTRPGSRGWRGSSRWTPSPTGSRSPAGSGPTGSSIPPATTWCRRQQI